MLSSPYIFPQSASDLSLGALATITGLLGGDSLSNSTDTFLGNGSGRFVVDVQQRLLADQSLPNLALIIVFILWKVLKNFRFFVRGLEVALDYIRSIANYCFRDNPFVQLLRDEAYSDDRQLTYDQALDSASITGIQSYFILANPRYARAFHREPTGSKTSNLIDVLKARATDGSGISDMFSTAGDSFASGGS